MIVKANGLVIREAFSGESDKVLTVLTAEFGKISVFARGVRKLTSKYLTATQLFSYSSFVMKKSETMYFMQEAEYLEGFFGIRRDVVALSLATYFAEVVSDVSTEERGEGEILSLILNCLYMLCEKKKADGTVKAVFELRLASLLGFTPNLVGCARCGKYECETAYLDVMDGEFTCDGCRRAAEDAPLDTLSSYDTYGEASITVPVSYPVLSVMRHIVYAKPKKIFSFSEDGLNVDELSRGAEKYLLNHLERSFNSLEFYRTLI